VLEVVYLIFNEGYAASSGERWVRTDLCEEALRLGRILAGAGAGEPEAHGLIALLEIQASRLGARLGPDGEPVLLLDQDRSRWDPLLIVRGLAALPRAEEPARAARPLRLQAAIAACHARALTAEETDWPTIARLYAALLIQLPTPVVALNRAVAVAMADGPEAGLALANELADSGALPTYHLLPAVRADLLAKLGRFDEAQAEFTQAATLAGNGAERTHLEHRAADAERRSAPGSATDHAPS
jgi:RNA polymerase sigma-70 factor (ECF subfamily)